MVKSARSNFTTAHRAKVVPKSAKITRPASTQSRPTLRDVPDIFDRIYEPTLQLLPVAIHRLS